MNGDRVVDLNDGSEEELSDLPMVGKQRARDLIAIDLFLIGRQWRKCVIFQGDDRRSEKRNPQLGSKR
jgi:hypothetical protein